MASRENWQRVEELFFECEGLTDEARRRFLDQACGDDLALRQRVERLLVADRSAGDRFERIVQRAALAEVEPKTAMRPSEVPTSIGPYRLVEVLGEGGMGTVYLAERADGVFSQRVAIKVVKAGLIGPSVERRFQQERQILARLEHPAVARLLDGGSTPEGLPYLVMEYVDGEPIDAYCDHHQLSIGARLDLFRKVCAGVQMAHSNLVVHRDLKPSNILVTDEGRPKLLDFGISKLLVGDEPVEGAALTLLGHRMLTPEYASPEQVREEPITTAVDVYALGLLLHRLLTGDRPYDLPSRRGEELRKAICDSVAERPSATMARLMGANSTAVEAIAAARATDPRRLRRLLTGDLDHIVSKALRKEPSQRYASVEQFAADIERHLEGLPVQARRGGLRYRAGRFVRRHRTIVATTLIAMLALGVGLVGQAREASRANREALASAQVVEFLTNLFNASNPYETLDTITLRDVLRRASDRIRDELEDQPLVQARLMSILGRTYHDTGQFEDALPLRRAVLERRIATLPPDHPDVATAYLDLADNLRVLARAEEAMPHYDQALELRRQHFGADSLETAQVLNNQALGLIRNADPSQAETLLIRVLEIRRAKLGRDYLVAQTLHNLARVAHRLGATSRAEALGHEALDIKAEVLPPDHPSTGRSLLMLSQVVWERDDYAEAEQLLRRAIDILRGAFGDHHLDVLGAVGDLAELRYLQGDRETAEAEQRRVLAAKREHLGDEHPEVAITLMALATQLRDGGQLAAAQELLQEALEIRRQALVAEHPAIARTMLALAETLALSERADEATSLARDGLRLLEDALPPGHPELQQGREVLAACIAAEREE